MTFLITIISGFLFGAILQFASLNKFNVISGLATLDDYAVAKTIALTIGVGAILINIEIWAGLASYHVKPFILGGTVLGGLIFGVGMAILGYCPGTLAISLGEGSLDALSGIIGGLIAGVIYTLILPSVKSFLGPDLGTFSLNTITGNGTLFFIMLFLVGAVFISVAFYLHKIEKTKNLKWVLTGIALAVLNSIVFLKGVSDRPIGASTTYPYVADILTGLTNNDYFEKIKSPGNWELIFLAGAFLAGLIISVIRKDFKLTLVHSNWATYKGTSKIQRAVWSLIGGFILIFGARMAGGCTSGHIISGGMQLAVSSLVFAVFVFTSFLITGRIFYGKK